MLWAQDSVLVSEAVIHGQRPEWRELLSAQRLEGGLLRKMGGLPIADALRHFSGLQLKDYGGIGGLKTVNIRGMGTQHVGVFYDGIALTNAQNGQIDLGRFSLDEMDALTVYSGQRQRLLQPAKDFSSAAALYLESREPQFLAGKRQHLRLRLRYGSAATRHLSLSYDRQLSAQWSATATTEWLTTSGNYSFRYRTLGGYDTTAVRQNGDVRSFRSEASLFYRSSKSHWRTKAYLYSSERGLPGAVVRNRFVHEDRQWDTHFFLQSSYRHHLSPKAAWLVNGKWSYDHLHYLSQPTPTDPGAMYTNNTYRRQELYLSLAQAYTLSSTLSFSVATDYAYDYLRADLYAFSFPRRHSFYGATALRYAVGNLEIQPSLLYTTTAEQVRQGQPAPLRKHLSPALTLTLPLRRIEGLSVQAFYKDIFRLPTLNETYYTFVGKSDLLPETNRQWNLSVHYAQPLWTMKTEVYTSRVKNKIVAIPTSNMFRWTMMNLGVVHIVGAEITASGQYTYKDWKAHLRATYTYERATDRTDKATSYYGHQIPYIPRHSGSALLSLGWRAWTALYSFIYTGSRYDQRTNEAANFAPAWYTSDLSLTYQQQHWQASLQVTNLFHQRFEVVKGYPMPGTQFRLSFQYSL